jgi:parallel beta-helix repeat protein
VKRLVTWFALVCVLPAQVVKYVGPIAAVPRYTYYVDPSGSDSANGLTPATAFQTVSKVSGLSLTPGQSVGFKRGGQWREALTVKNGVSYGAYSTGADPILNAGDLKTWTQGSGGGSQETGGLFASGFETSSFTDWTTTTTQTGTTIVQSATQVNHGSNSMRIIGNGTDNRGYLKKTVTALASGSTYYVRFFVYAASGSLKASSELRCLRVVTAPSTSKFYVGLFTDASGNVNAIRVQGPSAVIINNVTVSNFTMDAWNRVEVALKVAGAGSGGAQAWVNGTSISSTFTADTSAAVGADTLWLGNDNFGGGMVASQPVYYDDFKFDTSPIGVYSASGVPTTVWYTAQGADPQLVVFNGSPGTNAGAIASVDAANKWYWDGANVYVYSISDPASTVEVSTRDFVIAIHSAGTDNVKISNLQLKNSGYYNLKCGGGAGWVLSGLTVTNSGHGGIVFTSSASNATVRNTVVSYSNQIGPAASHEAITMEGVNGFTVQDTVVHDTKEDGIVAKYGSSNGVITRNTVYNTGAAGIYIDSANTVTVSFNVVHGVATLKPGIGISVEFASNPSHYNLHTVSVHHNVVYDCGVGMWFWLESGAEAFATIHDVLIAQNTITSNNRTNWGGIFFFGAGSAANYTTNNSITNNIMFSNLASGGAKEIRDDISAASGFSIVNNFFGTGEANDRPGAGAVTAASPMFNNAVAHDYTLQLSSTAIDAGVAIPGINDGYLGIAPDLGAFEAH